MQYSIWILNLEINIFTWKGFEQFVREETAHLATLRSKSIYVVNLLKETAEIEQEWQKSPAGTRQTDGKNMVWFGEIERKLAISSKTTFTYRSSSYLFYAAHSPRWVLKTGSPAWGRKWRRK